MALNLFKKKDGKEPKARKAAAAKEVTEQVQAEPSVQIAFGTTVLKNFHISEKSTRGLAHNHYTFEVAKSATKTDVKHAVQRAFKVNVVDVHLVNLPAKKRRIGRWMGTKAGMKKAIVVLKDGQSIAQAQP